MSIEEKIKTAKEDSWLKDSVSEKEFKEIKDNEKGGGMTRKEYDKLIRLMNNGALLGIIGDRLDGECKDVIPLEDAIAIVSLVYKEEREEKE